MSSPSKVTKVNYLYIRYLRFRSVRGDFLEGHSYASRCLFPLFPVPIPGFPSTKSGFLCAFGVWNPRFQGFRAQNRHFCAQEEGKVGSESVTAETLTTLPPHLRRRTSAPAHQHPHTSSSAPAPAYRHQRTRLATAPSNGTRRRQVLSSAV